jgi:hypothetical protein
MGPQSCGNPKFENFGTPIWESWEICHLDAGPMASHRIYYKGENDGFPQVRAVMSLVSSSLPMAYPRTKSVQMRH